jgi:RHS repeat-associated protein
MEDGRGNRYRYDPEGQLTAATYRAVNPDLANPTGALRTDSFTYDQLGNRQGWNHVANRGNWMNIARRDNGLNQYSFWENDHPLPDPQHWGSGMFYDDNFGSPWVPPGNGVMMAEGYITASYNALNQPVAVWSMVYNGTTNYMWFGYDPLGRCVKRWKGPAAAGTPGYNPATYFYYDGSDLVQEGPSSSTVDPVYVHGGGVDEIVASQVSGVWYNHHYDGQGNCILLSTATGGLQEQYDYDAFGYPYFYSPSGGKGGNVKTRFLFTGGEWISDLRIYDYRARMYQPELGRFLRPDSQEFAAGDYNLYGYCQ